MIESFEPGYLPGLGLGYDDLSTDNSALVMISITPFGQTGPNANLPATELTLYAASGQMWLTGHPARSPLKNGGSQPSYQAGLNAFAAIAGAYYGAVMHEQGSYIDLSMQETYAGMAEAFHNRASQLESRHSAAATSSTRSGASTNSPTAMAGSAPCPATIPDSREQSTSQSCKRSDSPTRASD